MITATIEQKIFGVICFRKINKKLKKDNTNDE